MLAPSRSIVVISLDQAAFSQEESQLPEVAVFTNCSPQTGSDSVVKKRGGPVALPFLCTPKAD